MPDLRRTAPSVLLIFQLLLCLSVFHQLKNNYPFFQHPPAGTDMVTNLQEAEGILAGTFPGNRPYERVFLYSYFLASLLFISGGSLVAARLLQSFLLLAISWSVYKSAKLVLSRDSALLAMTLAVFYRPFYIFAFFFLDTMLQAFLLIATIHLLLICRKAGRPLTASGAGIAAAAFVLIRPNSLLLLPVFLFFFRGLEHSRRMISAFLLAFCFLLFVPVARNYLVSGEPKLIVGSSSTFWIGNNEAATGGMLLGEAKKRIDDLAADKGKGVYFSEVWRFFREKPLSFIKLQLQKAHLFFRSYEIPNNINIFEVTSKSLTLEFLPFGFGLVGTLGLAGAGWGLLRRNNYPLQQIILSLVAYSFAVCVFFVISRFRIPAVPLLIILAASFSAELTGLFNKRLWKSAALPLLLLLIAAGIVFSDAASSLIRAAGHSKTIVSDEGTLYLDDNNLWRSRKIVRLNQGVTAEKHLVLGRAQSGALLRICYIAKKPASVLLIDHNGSAAHVPQLKTMLLQQKEGEGFYAGDFPLPAMTRSGRNVIRISAETPLLLPYDDSSTLGRSFFTDSSGARTTLSGELMIRVLYPPQK
ncbi:MAG: glycosyltransferase family 39 protein [Candidatus Wallbacteria bacterium]|nr:glycosyltransferase family 39 protein [Candidatus Wallbacteria bacterium]